MFENDHDLLMTTAYRVKLNSKKMKKLEKDYLTKRTKEQEEAVELRVGFNIIINGLKNN